ncbi:MAG: DNA (cytosine-5-)-methyltransferase [Bacteroidales bacterium]|nr:DNA (cytosine-5-)-methyltransferase [Bacteroidales bacterium]
MAEHRFPYVWNISDGYPAKGIEAHGKTVFGTFICGGGSSFGYKLAGFHHLGGVELDPKIAEVYKANHHPEHLFNMDIRDFNALTELPAELYNLDLLDGSPPCSTFSTAGSREDAWGKEKKFAEGQKLQTLDDLVFIYCDTIAKLKPKCCLLENVSGLVKGNAKSYAKRIVKRLNEIGYDVQVFLLNAATMGVPQARERVFFIGHRKDLDLPKLVLNFREEPILFGEFQEDIPDIEEMTPHFRAIWDKRRKGDTNMSHTCIREENTNKLFSVRYIHRERVVQTLTSNRTDFLYDQPRHLTEFEIKCVGTFPQDYKYGGVDQLHFLTGMSVPPVMTAQIAYQIYRQWLTRL